MGKITSFALDSIPTFIRQEHPNLTKFIEYYYEWMDSNSGAYNTLQSLQYISDVDQAQDELVENTNTTSPHWAQNSNKTQAIEHLNGRNTVSMVSSHSTPSLSSPYRYAANSKLGSPTFSEKHSGTYGQSSSGLDCSKKKLEKDQRYKVQSFHRK